MVATIEAENEELKDVLTSVQVDLEQTTKVWWQCNKNDLSSFVIETKISTSSSTVKQGESNVLLTVRTCQIGSA